MSVNSFSSLRKNSTNFDSLRKEVEKLSKPSESYNDDRFWQPAVDKAGNGYAVIRFLPPSEGADLPWVRVWSHGFQGPTGKWYIENSLTTINQPDPVSELNSELWNSGVEANKDIARKQKRKLTYISNILVIKDSANPQNEGKVFLYKYGKKIFDKIKDVMQPQFEDENPVNPFDFWTGANFKLKIRNVEGFRNYDKSEFEAQSAIINENTGKAMSDSELETLWKQEYDLNEFIDPKNFKSYDELKRKLNSVLFPNGSQTTAEKMISEEPRSIASAEAPIHRETRSKFDPADEGEENPEDYFQGLANDND